MTPKKTRHREPQRGVAMTPKKTRHREPQRGAAILVMRRRLLRFARNDGNAAVAMTPKKPVIASPRGAWQ